MYKNVDKTNSFSKEECRNKGAKREVKGPHIIVIITKRATCSHKVTYCVEASYDKRCFK